MRRDLLFKRTRKGKNRLSYHLETMTLLRTRFLRRAPCPYMATSLPWSSLTHGWQLTNVPNSCGLPLTCLTSGPHSQCPTGLWVPVMIQ